MHTPDPPDTDIPKPLREDDSSHPGKSLPATVPVIIGLSAKLRQKGPNVGKRSDQRGLWEADHLYLDLLTTSLWLQAHDRVSDAAARRRATVDLSWKVALGVEVRPHP